MNKYDERYEIRLAYPSEIDTIMQFIEQHWKHGHILSIDKQFFKYEFGENDVVNMIVAIDKETRSIEAIAGFLPCSHTNDSSKKDVWGSIWKVNDSHKNMTFLGVELIKRLTALLGCRCHLGIGINPNTTLPIRKIAFREKTEKMKHYYYLNPSFSDYRIAVINEKRLGTSDKTIYPIEFVEFHSIEEVCGSFNFEKLDTIPYKDSWYINKRFFQHPYYTYSVCGIKNTRGEVSALIIMREVHQFERKVLRIVDYIGDQTIFAHTSQIWFDYINRNQYEYIDFYTLGFDEKSILKAGFVYKDQNDSNIIPNYFEPFVQENSDIWVRYGIDGTLFCKADGDQDRPNQPRPSILP